MMDLVGVIRRTPGRPISHLERMPNQKYYKHDRPHILVYQPGRVGSNSVYEVVWKQLKENAHHLHTLGVSARAKSWDLPERIAAKKEMFRVITIVRDPIARNLSAWKSFFNCRTDFVKEFDHDKILTWFDDELKHFLGIDVFAYKFDKYTKWMTMKTQPTSPLLILRLEDLQTTLSSALHAFIPMTSEQGERIELPHKAKSEQYEIPKLPTWLLDKMLQSKYCTHFYTGEEIQILYLKYSK